MTNEVEAATKILATLEDERDGLIARMPQLAQARQAVAYAAKTGDKGAREKLARVNAEAVAHEFEIASVAAAICEAVARLNAARAGEASAKDRTDAEALRIKLSRFCELGMIMDDCITDFVGAANEMNTTLNDIHALGCPSPNAAQMRVLGTIAVKSFVMQIPWTAKEWEHLPPNQRKTFANLVTSWRDMIEQNIASRTEKKEEAA
jgi:hypothetical protein